MIHDSFGRVYCIDTLLAGIREFLSCFLIVDEKVVLSDPGPPCIAEEVLNSVKEIADNVDFIALSHIHVDHAGASYILAEEFDARILVHPKAAKHLINPEKLWKSSLQALGDVADIYGKPEPVDKERVIPIEDGQTIELGEDRIKAVYTPGHAVHHISYFVEGDSLLLSGESIGMLLKGKIIPTSPIPPLTIDDVFNTFKKIERLSPKKIGFCHFGFSELDDLMEKVKEKTKNWFEIAREAGNIDEFNEKLLQEDEDYRYLTEYYSRLKDQAGLIFSYPYRTVLEGILSLAKGP
ncbi:MAG: MBL fold metallo-hydrolase [Archaeoglobus sp.]|nr:MBL fold metallo-hydrolase [Archaeoglobus sp.]